MLAMIAPIESSERSQVKIESNILDRVPCFQPSHRQDSISKWKEGESSFGEMISNALLVAWEWIKTHVLVCFFDSAEEARARMVDVINEFYKKTPFSGEDHPTVVTPDQFLEEFSKLPEPIQAGIKDRILTRIKRYFPEKELQAAGFSYDDVVDMFLKRPFDVVSVVLNKNLDQEIDDCPLVMDAILAFKISLHDYDQV